MLKSMTIPTLDEGFDDIIIYNGGDEIWFILLLIGILTITKILFGLKEDIIQ